jgi:hypothetical protein
VLIWAVNGTHTSWLPSSLRDLWGGGKTELGARLKRAKHAHHAIYTIYVLFDLI